MNLTQQQLAKLQKIEGKWQSGYKSVDDIIVDYKCLIKEFSKDQTQKLKQSSKAICDIIDSVEKYNKFL